MVECIWLEWLDFVTFLNLPYYLAIFIVYSMLYIPLCLRVLCHPFICNELFWPNYSNWYLKLREEFHQDLLK